MYFQGCQPYRVEPCLKDEYGNSTCSGKPMEKNHRCTRMCYGNQDLDFKEDHRFSKGLYT
jgi:cathepsin B